MPAKRLRPGPGLGGALAAWLLTAAAVAGDTPELPRPLAPFEAHYRVGSGNVPIGTATIRLSGDARSWRYRSTLRVEGLFALFVDGPMRETTWLELHEGRLRPMAYRHQRGSENVRVVFDWNAQHAKVSVDGDSRRIALEPDSRDQSSAILAVMRALAAGERSVSFAGVDDEGKPERLRFRVTGEERIAVPLGSYDTVRVHRRHDSDRSTITWLAPALEWLPVRVEQHDGGELVARLELVELNGETSR